MGAKFVLGVHSGHNATAAILKDGQVIAAISEERFTRKKNFVGFPKKAIKFVLEFAKITIKQVDTVVIIGADPRSHRTNLYSPESFTAGDKKKVHKTKKDLLIREAQRFLYKHKNLALKKHKYAEKRYESQKDEEMKKVTQEYAKRLKCPKNKISFIEHHKAHALSTLFNIPKKQKTLVFTLDGEGDGVSATVNVFDKELERISETSKLFSLGWFYAQVTKHLGMTRNQHEFKVMGLAPYAKEKYVQQVYDKLKQHIFLKDDDSLEFDATFFTPYSNFFLEEELSNQRFDNIAGGAQLLVEELILEWVKKAIKKTGIRDIAISGGVFMNVKANMRLMDLKEVNSLFVMPSAGDESLVFGACYEGYKELCEKEKKKFVIAPIKDLYLGQEYSSKYVQEMIKRDNLEKEFVISKPQSIAETAAKLLARGEVVAHHNGRSEWGARALGNRSILANPTNEDTVQVINELIKGRDFWMPFTPSILSEGEKKYITNPRDLKPYYMCITFHSTKEGQKALKAAKHPYDNTIRPQVVLKEWNPQYHEIISEFSKLTGILGVLNTSFNLHGEPNVETPEDAIYTVKNSGLKYLVIGEFLFEKVTK